MDLAAELPLPDADARRALIRLYQGSLVLDGVDLDPVVARTEGVTAAFLKELLRRAALLAAEADGLGEGAIRVTGEQLTTALDRLLESRSQLTRVLLGGIGAAALSPLASFLGIFIRTDAWFPLDGRLTRQGGFCRAVAGFTGQQQRGQSRRGRDGRDHECRPLEG